MYRPKRHDRFCNTGVLVMVESMAGQVFDIADLEKEIAAKVGKSPIRGASIASISRRQGCVRRLSRYPARRLRG
jgi:hypothetical protein